ncbi:hypothetical protein [Ruegeria hyattellae]|uniref:hypothetical protein n=1 Tax=Ruegeria hyattellae TaxID=3233337 RepID=UPI00355C223C
MPLKPRRYSTIRKWYYRELAAFAGIDSGQIGKHDPLSNYIGGGIAAYKAFAISLNTKPGFSGDGLNIRANDIPNDTSTVTDLMIIIVKDYEDRNQSVELT